jgi:hypothetical protein
MPDENMIMLLHYIGADGEILEIFSLVGEGFICLGWR